MLSLAGIFFLQISRIEHDDSRQLPRCRRGDDFTLKSSFDQQWNPAAMIKMGMGEQDVIDAGRVEPKGLRVFFVQLAAALVEAAINQNFLSRTLDQMTRAGDTAVGAMK